MNWYYAVNNQQQGPVSEVEFAGLVTGGLVTDQTLVWHEGMPEWRSYGEIRTGQLRPPAPPVVQPYQTGLAPHEAVCAECGLVFPKDQTIQLGAAYVCAACKPIHLQKLREGVAGESPAPPPAAERRYAGFWIRYVAKFIDGLILVVIIVGPCLLLMFALAPNALTEDPSFAAQAVQLALNFLLVLAQVAYNTFFIGRFGASLGKMAVGLKVITAEGDPPGYWRAFGRAWAEQLSGWCCWVGYVIAAFDDQKRTLHDHICSTRVVFK